MIPNNYILKQIVTTPWRKNNKFFHLVTNKITVQLLPTANSFTDIAINDATAASHNTSQYRRQGDISAQLVLPQFYPSTVIQILFRLHAKQ